MKNGKAISCELEEVSETCTCSRVPRSVIDPYFRHYFLFFFHDSFFR